MKIIEKVNNEITNTVEMNYSDAVNWLSTMPLWFEGKRENVFAYQIIPDEIFLSNEEIEELKQVNLSKFYFEFDSQEEIIKFADDVLEVFEYEVL